VTSLAERMLAELRAWRVPMTMRELARRVKARDADVLAVLRSDPRFAQTASEPRRTYYLAEPFPGGVRAAGTAGTARLARGSQCARILAVLEDGNWHTTAEIHQRVGGCVLHSRIAELRARGFAIEHETTGQGASGSRYRLLDEPAGYGRTDSSTPRRFVERDGSPDPPPQPSRSPEQLEIEVAA
jgi:hypothetical protein